MRLRLWISGKDIQPRHKRRGFLLVILIDLAVLCYQFALLKNHPNQDVTGCAQCESKRIYRE